MSKHDEARENISFMDNKYDKAYKEMKRYITDMEAMEKKYEELKRDVENKNNLLDEYRYLLTIIDLSDLPQAERIKSLEEKLSKVGDEK